MNYTSLNGIWNVLLTNCSEPERVPLQMNIPGTLDENKIGYRDTPANTWHPDADLGNAADNSLNEKPITTRFTRKYTYEGEAKIYKKISYTESTDKRTFLEVERARCLKLLIDNKPVKAFTLSSLNTPCIFEVTGLIDKEHEFTFLSDNSYPALPHNAIIYSSAATNETQTNWNGLLGYIRLREEEKNFISQVYVYPTLYAADITVEVQADLPGHFLVALSSEALSEKLVKYVDLTKGANKILFENCSFINDIKLWDIEEGNLYELTASLEDNIKNTVDTKMFRFGVRTFCDNKKGRLALNGRAIFLRSEANCAVFPETGYPPMEVEAWIRILERYRSYGVNCMRFHSHCPPEAAFTAADQIGMLMQPELSHWNPKDAFEPEESYNYYKQELIRLVEMLSNHPSYVMLTFGNELQAGELGHSRMKELLKLARSLDSTRLYADASNPHYGNTECEPENDFCTT